MQGFSQPPRERRARHWAGIIPGVLILKGPGTIVAEGDQLYVNPTGNPGMATGGTGDVLAGIIGAFLARGDSPRSAALRAVWVHGRAADRAAYGSEDRAGVGEESLIASDIIHSLPEAIRDLSS